MPISIYVIHHEGFKFRLFADSFWKAEISVFHLILLILPIAYKCYYPAPIKT